MMDGNKFTQAYVELANLADRCYNLSTDRDSENPTSVRNNCIEVRNLLNHLIEHVNENLIQGLNSNRLT